MKFTARMAKHRYRIHEVGIHYYGRTFKEENKFPWRDELKAVYYIAKFRLWD